MIPQNGTSNMTELPVKMETLIFFDKKQKMYQGIFAFQFRFWLELSPGKNMEQCII